MANICNAFDIIQLNNRTLEENTLLNEINNLEDKLLELKSKFNEIQTNWHTNGHTNISQHRIVEIPNGWINETLIESYINQVEKLYGNGKNNRNYRHFMLFAKELKLNNVKQAKLLENKYYFGGRQYIILYDLEKNIWKLRTNGYH